MTTLCTNGWDLVAALRQRDLNRQLQALYDQGRLIKELTEQVSIPMTGEATVTLKLDAPAVKFDQSVSNFVDVTFPIRGGSLQNKFGTLDIPAKGLSLTVVADLKYVHLELEDGGNVLRLAVDFTTGRDGKNPVYNVVMEGQVEGWDPENNDFLGAALARKLQADAAKVDYDHPYHLGDVLLPQGTSKNLEPTGHAEFATQIVDRQGAGDDNAIALLMTTAGGLPGVSTAFPSKPRLIPGNHASSLVVSNEALVKKVIVPAVAKGVGVGAGRFVYVGGRMGNAVAPVTAQAVGLNAYMGGKYKMYMENLVITVAGGNAATVAYEVHAHPLVDTKETFYIKVTGQVLFTPRLQTDGHGNQLVAFTATEPQKPKGKIECKWWVYPIVAAAIVFSFGSLGLIIGAIAAAVVGTLMGTLTFPVGTPGGLGDLLGSAIVACRWPAQSTYHLDGVTLPGDLVITGHPS